MLDSPHALQIAAQFTIGYNSGMADDKTLAYATPASLRAGALVIYNDRRKAIAMLVAGLVLCAIGMIILLYYPRVGMNPSWFLSLGGIILVGGIWGLADRRPRLIVNSDGLTDAIAGYGLIPWDQVLSVRAVKNQYGPFLCIHLKDAPAIRARKSKIGDWLNPTTPPLADDEIAIIFSAFTITPEEVIEKIKPYNAGN